MWWYTVSQPPSNPLTPDMLTAMNTDIMVPAPTFVKWVSLNAIQRDVSHSSIRIGFKDTDQARRAVEQKIFYGRYNKRTEYGKKTRPRCMNCLEEVHTSTHCKADIMCPYCADQHPVDQCELRGKTTSNCTACARAIKTADHNADLKDLFSRTPLHLHDLPLDPTCPKRLAEKKKEAVKAMNPVVGQPTAGTQTQAERAGEVNTPTGALQTPRADLSGLNQHPVAGENNAQMSISQ